MDVINLIRKEGLRRGLSPRTIKTYIICIQKFFRVYKLDPRAVKKNDIAQYLEQLHLWGKSSSTINTNLNALKFLYEKILHKNLTIKVKHSKTPTRLPSFLTKQEVRELFKHIDNKKHQLMIKLLYATGMRVSELVSLKVKHFEFDHNYGWVREGKGKKDRLFILAQKLKTEILKWISQNKLNSNDWLFPSYNNRHYSVSSIQKIISRASKKAKIAKNVHPHTLRHSFATHLIENGYAVTEVQPLLGHNSLNTTMIYLHMASPQLLKVQSPFDTLEK